MVKTYLPWGLWATSEAYGLLWWVAKVAETSTNSLGHGSLNYKRSLDYVHKISLKLPSVIPWNNYIQKERERAVMILNTLGKGGKGSPELTVEMVLKGGTDFGLGA